MTLRTSSATVAVGDTDRGPLPCRVRAHRSCNRQHHRHDEEPYGSASRRTRPEEETTVRADTRSGGAMGTKYYDLVCCRTYWVQTETAFAVQSARGYLWLAAYLLWDFETKFSHRRNNCEGTGSGWPLTRTNFMYISRQAIMFFVRHMYHAARHNYACLPKGKISG